MEFLAHLANLPDERETGEARRFMIHFQGLFENEVPWTVIQEWTIRLVEEEAPSVPPDEQLWKFWLLPLRDAVRQIWKSTDTRFKEWGVFRILEKFFLVGDRTVGIGPVLDDREWQLGTLGPPSDSEEALMLLVRRANLTKFCGNSSCETPFFWASRRSQKYCCEPCAAPAQREAKNKWWASHGPEWRKERHQKQERKGGKHGKRSR